ASTSTLPIATASRRCRTPSAPIPRRSSAYWPRPARADEARFGGQRRKLRRPRLRDSAATIVSAHLKARSGKGEFMLRLMLGCVAALVLAGQATAAGDVKRGDYLMNTIMTCANCHSPKGPPAAVAGKNYSGGLSWDEPPFKVTAPNITQDRETGIGS